MISSVFLWAGPRKLSLGFLALFLFACYDLWIHPALFSGSEMSLCLMKELWGIPCPACGTAHGIQFLAKGNISAAFYSNPFSILTAFLFPIFLTLLTIDLIGGKQIFKQFFLQIDLFFQKYPFLFWLGILLVVANWYWNFVKLT